MPLCCSMYICAREPEILLVPMITDNLQFLFNNKKLSPEVAGSAISDVYWRVQILNGEFDGKCIPTPHGEKCLILYVYLYVRISYNAT